MTKRCNKCRQNKPEAEFYKNVATKDSLTSMCKVCIKMNERTYRQSEKGRRSRTKYESTERVRAARRKSRYRWIKNHPVAELASVAVWRAIRAGKIIKPNKCEECFSAARLHAHHEDYSKPLEVKWLCPRCHSSAHIKAAIA